MKAIIARKRYQSKLTQNRPNQAGNPIQNSIKFGRFSNMNIDYCNILIKSNGVKK